MPGDYGDRIRNLAQTPLARTFLMGAHPLPLVNPYGADVTADFSRDKWNVTVAVLGNSHPETLADFALAVVEARKKLAGYSPTQSPEVPEEARNASQASFETGLDLQ